jgi:hypothetical protein
MLIGEDIESRSDYPSAPRRTTPTAWLRWTCLSPVWGETKPTCNRASRPLEVNRDTEKKRSRVPLTPQMGRGQAVTKTPSIFGSNDPGLASKAHKPSKVHDLFGRDR